MDRTTIARVNIAQTSAFGDLTASTITVGTATTPATGYVNAVGLQVGGNAVRFTKAYDSGIQTYNLQSVLSLAHGLGSQPLLIELFMRCNTATHNFATDDELKISTYNGNGADQGIGVVTTASDLKVLIGATSIRYFNKTTATSFAMNATSFNLVVRAWV